MGHGHRIGTECNIPLNEYYFVLTLYELVACSARSVKPCPCLMDIS
jgi:hypothetical protein